jgi:UDP-N-acetylmuramyl tripeptide synthase
MCAKSLAISRRYVRPSQSTVGVGRSNGTNGKTTITYLIEKIGTKHGKKVGLMGHSVPGLLDEKFLEKGQHPKPLKFKSFWGTWLPRG